jgi:hypothetical protein
MCSCFTAVVKHIAEYAEKVRVVDGLGVDDVFDVGTLKKSFDGDFEFLTGARVWDAGYDDDVVRDVSR